MRTISHPETRDVRLYSESFIPPVERRQRSNIKMLYYYLTLTMMVNLKTTGEQTTENGKEVKQ